MTALDDLPAPSLVDAFLIGSAGALRVEPRGSGRRFLLRVPALQPVHDDAQAPRVRATAPSSTAAAD